MKIAVLNEFSQAPKNGIILKELKSVVEPMGHQVFNAAMEVPLTDQDVPEAYTQENPRLTYLHLGIMSALLLNSGAVDFVVTGCGTAQGALMSLNFVKAFGSPKGMGYPDGRKEAQNRNADLLFDVKKKVAKPLLDALRALDPQMVKECMIPRFLDCFYAGCQDQEIRAFVDEMAYSKGGN